MSVPTGAVALAGVVFEDPELDVVDDEDEEDEDEEEEDEEDVVSVRDPNSEVVVALLEDVGTPNERAFPMIV